MNHYKFILKLTKDEINRYGFPTNPMALSSSRGGAGNVLSFFSERNIVENCIKIS